MTLAITGRTNRAALLAGARAGGAGSVHTYPDRTAAARAILAEARKGDVIVYENDLPDHYP
jgi:UDP-N-acetylmuramoyl-tripeptide--D-alanyl-D-alanine ligase